MFQFGTEFSTISDINAEYNFIVTSFDDGYYYDHRVLGNAYKETTTDIDGNFSIDDIEEWKYLLIYSSEEFGWHKQIVNISEDMNINLVMRETIPCSGSISENTIWKANIHIVITNDFVIPENITLEIDENTVIEMENASFIILGNLNIAELINAPVIFTSSKDMPSKGDWNGITNYSFNGKIDNCIIQWAETGLKNEGFCELNNIAILNNLQYGITLDYKSSIVNNAIIWDSINGIYGFWTKEDSIDFKLNNSIVANSDIGINIYESSPIINNSYFINNRLHFKSQYNSYPNISHCYFGNASQNAIYSAKEYNHNGQITITNCEFKGNYSIIKCHRSADILATNNNFMTTNNYVFELSYYYGGNTVSAQNNWWGTSTETEIQNLIYDETDEPGGDNIGTVDYSNWFSHEVANAGVQP